MGYYFSDKRHVHEEWTIIKSVLFILLTFIILLVLIMLANNYGAYDHWTKAFSWIWGTVTAVLGSFGLVRKKDRSFAELLDLRPAKYAIVAYFLITLFFFYAVECPVHRLRFVTQRNGEGVNDVIVTLSGFRYGKSVRGSVDFFSLKRGKYQYIAELEGYKTKEDSVDVRFWSFWPLISTKKVNFSPSQKSYGALFVQSYIDGDTSGHKLHLMSLVGNTEVTVEDSSKGYTTPHTFPELTPGVYKLIVTKVKGKSSYRKVTKVAIAVDETCKVKLELPYIPPPRGKVTIVSEPSGAFIYIGGRYMDKQTPATIELDCGSYTYELRKMETTDYGFLYKGSFRIDTIVSSRLLPKVKLDNHILRLKPFSIHSKPKAHIFVNGRYVGQTNSIEPIYLFDGEKDNIILKEYGYRDEPVSIGDLPFTDTISLIKID